jgi:hypothetical protein
MLSPETCKIEYLGFSSPHTPNELKLEIAGLEHLIAIAQERIAAFKQSLLLAEIVISERDVSND